jgi:hypothetical protein
MLPTCYTAYQSFFSDWQEEIKDNKEPKTDDSPLQNALATSLKYSSRTIKALGDFGIACNGGSFEDLQQILPAIQMRSISAFFLNTNASVPDALLRDSVTCFFSIFNPSLAGSLATHRTVTDLTIHHPMLINLEKELHAVLVSCPLKTLRLQGGGYKSVSSYYIGTATLETILKVPSLELLQLMQINLNIQQMQLVANALQNKSPIRTLVLQRIQRFDLLAEALSSNTTVESLSCIISDHHKSKMLRAIKNNPKTTIKVLKIQYNIYPKVRLSRPCFKDILSLIRRDFLYELSVTLFNPYSEEQKQKLVQALSQNRKLRILRTPDLEPHPIYNAIFQPNHTLEYWEQSILENRKRNNIRLWRVINTSILIGWMRGNRLHPFNNSVQPLLKPIIAMAISTDREQYNPSKPEKFTMKEDFALAEKTLPPNERFMDTRYFLNESRQVTLSCSDNIF